MMYTKHTGWQIFPRRMLIPVVCVCFLHSPCFLWPSTWHFVQALGSLKSSLFSPSHPGLDRFNSFKTLALPQQAKEASIQPPPRKKARLPPPLMKASPKVPEMASPKIPEKAMPFRTVPVPLRAKPSGEAPWILPCMPLCFCSTFKNHTALSWRGYILI